GRARARSLRRVGVRVGCWTHRLGGRRVQRALGGVGGLHVRPLGTSADAPGTRRVSLARRSAYEAEGPGIAPGGGGRRGGAGGEGRGGGQERWGARWKRWSAWTPSWFGWWIAGSNAPPPERWRSCGSSPGSRIRDA